VKLADGGLDAAMLSRTVWSSLGGGANMTLRF
jgi:hypothetical protein